MAPHQVVRRVRDWRAFERRIIVDGKDPRRFADLELLEQARVVGRIASQEWRKAKAATSVRTVTLAR